MFENIQSTGPIQPRKRNRDGIGGLKIDVVSNAERTPMAAIHETNFSDS